MNINYINGMGIYDRFFNSIDELKLALSGKNSYSRIKENNMDILLSNRDLIQREDRAVLNKLSIMAVNAVNDLLNHIKIEDTTCLNIYSANDYNVEVTSLCRFLKYLLSEEKENFWKNISIFSKIVNPLELLRGLPTNILYFLSKSLNSNQKGIPIDAGNISSIACFNSLSNNDSEFLIASACSALGTKNMVDNNRKKIIDISKGNYDKHLSYNANVIYMGDKKETSLAFVMDINMHYFPEKSFNYCLKNTVNKNTISPDYIIIAGVYNHTYEIESENVLNKYISAKLLDYRNIIGIAGRSEIIMNLICCLLDDSVERNSIICINGYDYDYGFGNIFIQKLI